MSFVYVKTGFYRKYLIFANEDTGYEAGRKPSGHVKLEVRDGKGKLRSVIHNIRPGNGAFDYALYLLCADGRFTERVKAGVFRMENVKGELEWPFDPLDAGKSGCGIDKFNVFAVIVEHADKRYPDDQRVRMHAGGVICPLAAYANKRTDWRSIFESLPFKKEASEVKPYPAEAALKYIPPEQDAANRQEKLLAQDTRTERREKPQEQPDARQEQDAMEEYQVARPGEDAMAEYQGAWPERQDTQPERQNTRTERHDTQKEQPGDKPAACDPNISNQGCAYLDSNQCSAPANGTAGDSCSSCIFRSGESLLEPSHTTILPG